LYLRKLICQKHNRPYNFVKIIVQYINLYDFDDIKEYFVLLNKEELIQI